MTALSRNDKEGIHWVESSHVTTGNLDTTSNRLTTNPNGNQDVRVIRGIKVSKPYT